MPPTRPPGTPLRPLIPVFLAYGAEVSCGLHVLVALIWFVPDRRIERIIHEGE